MRLLIAASLVLFALSVSTCPADVTLPGILSDNMVLQRDVEIPIWGLAADGESVTVELAGQKVTAISKDGAWQVKIPPQKAGGPFELKVTGKNTLTVKDILIGEVWVASGQSNMEGSLSNVAEKDEAAGANDDGIRFCTIRHEGSEVLTSYLPSRDVKAQWVSCTPATARKFSAVGFFFIREIRRTRKVPVGIVCAAVSGSSISPWMSPLGWYMMRDRDLAELHRAGSEAAWQKRYREHAAQFEEYRRQVRDGNVPKVKVTNSFYNLMIAPLMPFAIRGVIWYQGESDVERGGLYGDFLIELIRGWRKEWGQGDFPFYAVQLPSFEEKGKELKARIGNWPVLREAQERAVKAVPNAAVAAFYDYGERDNVHPAHKKPAGERLALLARAFTYGEKVECFGPEMDSMKIEANQAVLSFRHAGGGLIARGGELKGFTIRGEDKTFVPAQARIEGDRVLVSSPDVAKPVAVRYAWADWAADASLTSKEGLPAVPFRTDSPK